MHMCMPAGEPHEAEGDLFLCPALRQLADAPGVTAFEYRGNGNRLVLPDKDNLGKGVGWRVLSDSILCLNESAHDAVYFLLETKLSEFVFCMWNYMLAAR